MSCQRRILGALRCSRNPSRALERLFTARSLSSLAAPDLAFQVVSQDEHSHPQSEANPPRTAILLHGLLGSGRNWRSWSRRLSSALDPEPHSSPSSPAAPPPTSSSIRSPWRIVLVDLRAHGNSGRLALPPPTTIRSAAEDVLRLVAQSPWDPSSRGQADAVIGHSVGGKVALEYARLVEEQLPAAQGAQGSLGALVAPPKQVWVLDSIPGALDASPGKETLRERGAESQAPGSADQDQDKAGADVTRVLHMVLSLPRPFPSRRWLVEEVKKRGFSPSLADWLGSSLVTIEGQGAMDFQFDLQGALDLYESYRVTDLFPFVEKRQAEDTEIHFVRAGKSDRWTPDVLTRLEAAATAHPDYVSIHVLPDAGHWLQADNPQGLVDLMAPVLSEVH